MMKSVVTRNLLALGLFMVGLAGTQPARSQSITAAKDGTGTVVNASGNRIDISGGTLSSDHANLFHSFQQFGLNANQIANFLANPQIHNILARVVGGSPSMINGLLKVTGGNSNLFLINPAGIVFGANASLNVPASFTATTANGIGFGDRWLNASGSNDYGALVGHPNGFAFTMSQPGAIVNAGNLAVGQGSNLMLAGGTVVNTGQLSAPGGQMTVAAVPGEHVLRISQPGNPLSLEIQSLDSLGNRRPAAWTTPIASLPQLLTGGGGSNATGLTVNADGTVQLTGSGVQVATNPGATTISGTVSVAGYQSGQQGGTVNLLGDDVKLLSATVNASGMSGGGTVRIGGDRQGNGTVPNASSTYVSSDSAIAADAWQSGNGGKVIAWADGKTDFYGSITARGGADSGDGGFVEVSGKDNLTFQGTVDTSALHGNLGTLLLDPTNILVAPEPPEGLNQATTTFISQDQVEGMAGNNNLILQAKGDFRINPLTNGVLNLQPGTGGVEFRANYCGANCTSTSTGSFFMNPTDTILAPGRNITIAAGSPTAVGGLNRGAPAAIVVGNIDTSSLTGRGGTVTLAANSFSGNKNIQAGNITTSSQSGNGGAVTLNAYVGGGGVQGNIQVGTIDSRSIASGTGGDVTLSTKNTNNSTITTTGNINSGGQIGSGNINFQGKVVLNADDSNFNSGNGNITFSNTVNGTNNGAQNLTLSSGKGTISFGAEVGNKTQLGDLTLTGKQFNLAQNVSGTGNLTLQPGTPGLNIAVGNKVAIANPDTLDLNSTKLALFKFQQIQIGRQDGTGTVTLYNNAANGGTTPFNSSVNIAGGSTLVGPNLGNQWNITGANSGDLNGSFKNGLTFNNIKNLTAGSATDSFVFQKGGSVSGNITGIGTTNTLNYSNYGSPVQVDLAAKTTTDVAGTVTGSFTNIGNVIGSSTGDNTLSGANTPNTWDINKNNAGNINGTLTFADFQNLKGGSTNDIFRIHTAAGVSGNIIGGSTASTLDYSASTDAVTISLGKGKATGVGGTISNITGVVGGTGNNTLIGADTSNTWNITKNDTGNINSTLTFTKFQNLTGGSTSDTFKLSPTASVSGNISGGSAVSTLDYSAVNTGVAVDLGAGKATSVGGTVSNITKAIGGPGNNTLTGPNTDNAWNISSNNSGTINNNLNFSNFQNLTGGSSNDTFKIANGVKITGVVDGGSGFNSLDYSAYGQSFKVNLKTGTATGTGGIRNIQAPLQDTASNQPPTSGSTPIGDGSDSGSNSAPTNSAFDNPAAISRNLSNPSQENSTTSRNGTATSEQAIHTDLQGQKTSPILVQEQQNATSSLCVDDSLAYQIPGIQQKLPACPVSKSQSR